MTCVYKVGLAVMASLTTRFTVSTYNAFAEFLDVILHIYSYVKFKAPCMYKEIRRQSFYRGRSRRLDGM